MLMWHRRLWLIDHGATLYFHHAPGWESDATRPKDSFPMIRHHVLLHRAGLLAAIDQELARALDPDLLATIAGWIPEDWLVDGAPGRDVDQARAAYARYLRERIEAPRAFVEEAARAR